MPHLAFSAYQRQRHKIFIFLSCREMLVLGQDKLLSRSANEIFVVFWLTAQDRRTRQENEKSFILLSCPHFRSIVSRFSSLKFSSKFGWVKVTHALKGQMNTCIVNINEDKVHELSKHCAFLFLHMYVIINCYPDEDVENGRKIRRNGAKISCAL